MKFNQVLNEKWFATEIMKSEKSKKPLPISIFKNPTTKEWRTCAPQGARGIFYNDILYMEGHDDLFTYPLSIAGHDLIYKILVKNKVINPGSASLDPAADGMLCDLDMLLVQRDGMSNILTLSESYAKPSEVLSLTKKFKKFLTENCEYLSFVAKIPSNKKWYENTDRDFIGFDLKRQRK